MANKEKDREALLDELVEELVDDGKRAEDLLGENGILKQLTKRVLERMLEAEMADHLGYEKGDPAGRGSGNSRNGKTCKKVKTDQNEVTLAVPRDRNGAFEPHIVPKHQRRLKGFDDKVISLYARGMTDREI